MDAIARFGGGLSRRLGIKGPVTLDRESLVEKAALLSNQSWVADRHVAGGWVPSCLRKLTEGFSGRQS